jgi:hypothetical protein
MSCIELTQSGVYITAAQEDDTVVHTDWNVDFLRYEGKCIVIGQICPCIIPCAFTLFKAVVSQSNM